MKGTRPEANLTGGQIQHILDKMLYDSVSILMPYRVFDPVLTVILSSVILDKRRKISSMEYHKSIDVLIHLVLNDTPTPFEDVKRLKLERTLYLKYLTFLVEEVEQHYLRPYQQWVLTNCAPLAKHDPIALALTKVESRLGIDREHLWGIYYNVKQNLEDFKEFKTSIVEQYINLAHKYTSTQIRYKNKSLNYDDLFQNIMTAISKAIDKYDSSKGALTSYVKYWIINAQNQNTSHIENQAYEITYNQRQKVAKHETHELNFSSKLTGSKLTEHRSPEHIYEEEDYSQRILRLIKIADVDGLFRLSNNIDEVFFPHELLHMQSRDHSTPLGV